jgi:hypothetical protein
MASTSTSFHRAGCGLPNADLVELEGIGHSPQPDVPTETGQLILGFTAG